jgi:branched-chain amino acid transport system substrate-binding protein
VALAALLVGGAAACKKDSGTTGTGAGCPVSGLKIGFFGALSGENAGLVTPSHDGAQMALDKYNAAHADCKVTMVDYDSQGSADKAPALATGAANDNKVIAILGPAFSGESEVAVPIFQAAGLLALSQSATRDDLSTHGWTVWRRGVGHDSSQGPAGGRYVVNVAKAKKVYLVQDDSAYGKGLADNAKPVLQPVIVGTDKVTTGDRKFDAIVTKVVNSGADAVYYGGYTAEAAPFLKQLRAAGYHGLFVGGDGIYDDSMLSTTGKSDVEGTVATCPCAPATQAGANFPAQYKAKFSKDAGAYADVGYDLMNILLEGIAAGKTTRASMLAFISSYNKAGAVSGVTYSWPASDNGELDPSQVRIWAYKATNGAWVPDQEIPKS